MNDIHLVHGFTVPCRNKRWCIVFRSEFALISEVLPNRANLLGKTPPPQILFHKLLTLDSFMAELGVLNLLGGVDPGGVGL